MILYFQGFPAKPKLNWRNVSGTEIKNPCVSVWGNQRTETCTVGTACTSRHARWAPPVRFLRPLNPEKSGWGVQSDRPELSSQFKGISSLIYATWKIYRDLSCVKFSKNDHNSQGENCWFFANYLTCFGFQNTSETKESLLMVYGSHFRTQKKADMRTHGTSKRNCEFLLDKVYPHLEKVA